MCVVHNVGLVDSCHLLAAVQRSTSERKLGDSHRLFARDDLQALDHAVNALVLQARVLALRVLADDQDVNVRVASLDVGNSFAAQDVGKEIQTTTATE